MRSRTRLYRPSVSRLCLTAAARGALILDIAGIKKDEFFQANALLRERCNGAYVDCTNKPLIDAYHQFIFQRIGALHE